MLHGSAADWTRGNLDGFLDDYAEDATFVGSSGLVHGRERIREGYVRGYWSSGMPADGLRFHLLDVRTAATDAAVAVGRYELFDRETGATNASGLFSLVLRRSGDGWTIVHDHSSDDDSG
jgi:beta-aspartyl-peptidase (threonine type)